jgi:glycosyltransferase involved in cell wall biosynthesis
VSVVIPCYRYGHYLPAAIAGALDQSGVDVEVIIVDDASPDGSADVARALADSDERVRVLVHEENAGHIATYNDGLALAAGDYVTLVSADDLLTPDSLTRAVALMEHHPGVGFVYGYARSFAGEPEPVANRVRNWSVYPGRQWLGLAARRGRCFLSSPEAVMRREALAETDLYDPRLPHSGDFDMWLRTAARWDVGRVNGPVQAHYRVHDQNMHLTTYAGWITDLIERRRTFQLLFDERAPELPEVQALRPVAMRALAREARRRAKAAAYDSDAVEARAYLEFAAETWPADRSGLGRVLPRMRRVDLAAERMVHHLRWRRERRYGT